MKKILFTVILLPMLSQVLAQDFVDNALLFSQTQAGGSARIQAIGGAQVSLGGDYSSALSNPAGLGMFNRSEITFSLGLNDNQTTANYFGNSSNDGRTALTIPGFSYIQKQSDATGKYLGGAFGFTFTRTNNFNRQYSYSGDNSESSLLDYFINDATGLTPVDLEGDYYYSPTGLAYGSYLIQDYQVNSDPMFWDTEAYPLYDDNGTTRVDFPTVRQSESVLRKGAQNQLSISYGGNYDDTFFFGASIGVSTIRFKQDQVYRESNFRYPNVPQFDALDSFVLDESFDIQGSGVNFTLGAIYRPVAFLQLGASVATPTFYNLTDSYTARIDSYWNNFDYFGDGETILNNEYAEFDAPFISEYDLKTPGKATLGVSLISKYGFVSGDVEFVNYSKTKYTSNLPGESYSPENDAIKSVYENVVNFRLGAEFRYEMLRVRAGYNHLADPYRTRDNGTIETISAGLGARFSAFFLDFAALYSQSEGQRIPYRAGSSFPTPVAGLQHTTTNYMLTLGFPF